METISQYLLTFLLNASWQIPLIAAVAALGWRLMRNGPAAHRHIVCAAALTASLLLPLASVRSPGHESGNEVVVQYAAGSLDGQSAVAAPVNPARATATTRMRSVNFAQTTATVLLAAYVLLLLWRVIKLLLSWRRTVGILRSARVRPVSPAVQAIWDQCLGAFGLKGVQLLASPDLNGPVTAGLLRETVILPDVLLEEGSEEVLLTAIGHEMAHIARRDFILNLLYEVLYLPVCFHPAAWILRRALDRTREIACDELVVRRVLNATAYARSILSIASTFAAPAQPGAALGVFDGDILEERLRRLVAPPASWKHARALLATGLAALACCAVLVSGLALKARAQGGASQEMSTAAAAYNNGNFAAAVQHFESAVQLAPANLDAKMFLANALLRLFFVTKGGPGSPLLSAATRQYQDVLATDPQNKQAVRGMMAVTMEARRMEEAREWTMKLIGIDGADKTGYYTAGLLVWTIVYPEFQRASNATGGRMDQYRIPDANVRKELRERHAARLEDGVRMLETAIQFDPNYDEAMAYLNLLYRLKSGLVDSEREAADLLAKADSWVGKALAAKRLAQKRPAASVQLDVNGPAPGPPSAHAMVAAPPPPPPPPLSKAREHQIASADPPKRQRNAVEQPGSYWQVLGATDMPAIMLVRLLREKGFAGAMHHTTDEEVVRVMAGPYFDQQSVDRGKAALESAGFRTLRLY